jgi:ribosome-associated translation inhibitor RaiA
MEASITEQGTDIPIQIIGLPKNDIETRKAEEKFRRSIEALFHIHPDISEARAVVKTTSLEKERKRYEIQVQIRLPKEQFELSDEGWSVEEIFEKIGVKIKRLVTKPRDKPSHHRHPSRTEMEQARFAE